MITQIFLQLDEVSGVQLKVFNELKKHDLRAIKHVIKDAPNGGKLLAMEVESDEALDQETVQNYIGSINGVRALLKVAAREVETGPNQLESARELMLHTMQAFTHPARGAGLIREISAAASEDDLKALMDRWYAAISDNPDGAQRVDELRKDLLGMLGGAK